MPRPPSPRARALTGAVRPLPSHYSGFESPEQLAGDARISPSVRESLLHQWAEDLKAQLRASDENMASDQPGLTGDVLRRVQVCIEALGGLPGHH